MVAWLNHSEGEHVVSKAAGPTVSSASRSVLLERESQLASFGRYAVEAGQGSGRLVLVAGEAGVGKSTLLETLRQDSRRRPVVLERL